MRAKYHFSTSIPFAGIAYFFSKDYYLSAAVLLSHIFIDLDHLYDYAYYAYEKKEKISVKNFFEVCYNRKLEKIYLILHSYEIFAIISIAVLYIKNSILNGILIGGLTHLALDSIFNGNRRYSYLLTYRVIKKFSADSFYEKSSSCKTV
ncbi:MAG TPA: hypothetical protein PKY81_09555 [bacterium]|nr:hypothetical protein [bacterium]